MSLLCDWDRLKRAPRLYSHLLSQVGSLGAAAHLVQTRFPFIAPVPKLPRRIGVEFTNSCNLQCTYCDAQNSAIKGKVGFMTPQTLDRLVQDLQHNRVFMVRIIGSGEPTLHPRFDSFSKKLANSASVLSLITNGQLLDRLDLAGMADVFQVVEVSVDGDTREEYERFRVGGSFEKLLINLSLLRSAVRQRRSHLLVHIRVMIRRTDSPRKPALQAFWTQHGDVVSFQMLTDYFHADQELFQIGGSHHNEFRQCEAIFKSLGVNWNGDVPLCPSVETQLKKPGGLIIGNINTDSLEQIWTSATIREYRQAHKRQSFENVPACRGCPSAWGNSLQEEGRRTGTV